MVGMLGVIAFLITGQMLKYHDPHLQLLSPEMRMMYVSRHIYVLAAALVNVVLGLYVQMQPPGCGRPLQYVAFLLIVLPLFSLLLAFVSEPRMGLAGRSWRSYFGLIALFTGVMTHLVASAGRRAN